MGKLVYKKRPSSEEIIKKYGGTFESNIYEEYQKEYENIQYAIDKEKEAQIKAIVNSDKAYVMGG